LTIVTIFILYAVLKQISSLQQHFHENNSVCVTMWAVQI